RFVERMQHESLRAGLPWTWEDYPDYLTALETRGVGVNVASFVGHSAIRVRVMGAAATERPATPEERAAMAALVREAVTAGAIGRGGAAPPPPLFSPPPHTPAGPAPRGGAACALS